MDQQEIERTLTKAKREVQIPDIEKTRSKNMQILVQFLDAYDNKCSIKDMCHQLRDVIKGAQRFEKQLSEWGNVK